jgi:hypothetical protein
MKKGYSVALAVLMAGTSVGWAQNAVPYADSYEGYNSGSNLVGTVWQGAVGQALATVTNGTPTQPGVGYPLPSAGHAQILSFSDGPITNSFDGSTSNVTTIAVDTMIQPVFADAPTGNQLVAVSNSQMSLYFDTNGYINIFHGILDETVQGGGQPGAWSWTSLNQGASAISSGAWVRLTITVKYLTGADKGMFFKIAQNGVTLTNSAGYADADSLYPTAGGAWFLGAGWPELRIRSIILNGNGKLDDLVVATNEVGFAQQYATNNTPISWMQQQGLNTNETYPTWDDLALSDTDGDSVAAWAEYIAGTQPTNENSKLVIVSAALSNGVPILKWIGTTNAVNPYIIQWTSNLLSITSWTTVTGGIQRTEGTNEVTLPAPTVSPSFLRVNVTTNSP